MPGWHRCSVRRRWSRATPKRVRPCTPSARASARTSWPHDANLHALDVGLRHRIVDEPAPGDRRVLPRHRSGRGDGARKPGGSGRRPLRRGPAAEALPVRSASIDVVTAAGSLNYAGLDQFFPDVARVLREGGALIVYDFSAGRRFADSETLDEWFTEFLRRYPKDNGSGGCTRCRITRRRGRGLQPGRLGGVRSRAADGPIRVLQLPVDRDKRSRTRSPAAKTGQPSANGWRARWTRCSKARRTKCCSRATSPTSFRPDLVRAASRPRQSARSPPRCRTAARRDRRAERVCRPASPKISTSTSEQPSMTAGV